MNCYFCQQGTLCFNYPPYRYTLCHPNEITVGVGRTRDGYKINMLSMVQLSGCISGFCWQIAGSGHVPVLRSNSSTNRLFVRWNLDRYTNLELESGFGHVSLIKNSILRNWSRMKALKLTRVFVILFSGMPWLWIDFNHSKYWSDIPFKCAKFVNFLWINRVLNNVISFISFLWFHKRWYQGYIFIFRT